MDIRELTKKLSDKKSFSHNETVILFQKAKIIDKDGYYHKDFFTKETVEKDRQNGKPLI